MGKNISIFLTILVCAGTIRAQGYSLFSEKTRESYVASHTGDSLSWWLIDQGSDSLLGKIIGEVNDCIGVFRERIPPTTPLADYLKKTKFEFGYLSGDSVYFPNRNATGSRDNLLSICFVSRRDHAGQPAVSTSTKNKRLSIWGVRLPETIFAALLFYQLQTLALDSNQMNDQEKRNSLMIAANIFNDAGRGDFFNYLDSLVDPLPDADPLSKLNAAELKNIDQRSGARILGQDLAREVVGIYESALNSRLMLKRHRQR